MLEMAALDLGLKHRKGIEMMIHLQRVTFFSCCMLVRVCHCLSYFCGEMCEITEKVSDPFVSLLRIISDPSFVPMLVKDQ